MGSGERIHASTLSEAGFDSLEAASQLRTASPADVDRSLVYPGAVYSVVGELSDRHRLTCLND